MSINITERVIWCETDILEVGLIHPIAEKNRSQGTWFHHPWKQLDLLQVKRGVISSEHLRKLSLLLTYTDLTYNSIYRETCVRTVRDIVASQLQGKPFLLPGYWRDNGQWCHWNNNSDNSGDFFWLNIFPFNVRWITERCIKHPRTAERILISKHPCL